MKKVKVLRKAYQRAPQYELPFIVGKVVRKSATKTIYDVLRPQITTVGDTNARYIIALQDAIGGTTADTLYKDQLLGQLLTDMDLLADAIEINCDQDPLYIVYLGLKVHSSGQSHEGNPSIPANFRVETTLTPGTVLATYEIPEPGMFTSIVFEWSEDQIVWHNGQSSTSTNRCLLTGLPSRKEIYVRCYSTATKNRKSEMTAALPVFVL